MITKPGQLPATSDSDNLEHASKKAPLTLMKQLLEETRGTQTTYWNRCRQADRWWHSVWDYQYPDGRRWGADPNDEEQQIWPWRGASDTRDRTVDMVVAEYATVQLFALMNAKLQTKSTRPTVSMKQSQQATVLLNWMVYSHMSADMDLEIPLAINWRNARGASILWVDWEQERRIDRMTINLQMVEQSLGNQGMFQDWLNDPKVEDDLVKLVQQFSPIVTTAQAKGILNNLREGKTAELPVPYVYVSRPRITALRPYIDILFDPDLDQIQRARWLDRVEFVTETELTDRIETMQYDPAFVKKAIALRGMITTNEYRAQPLAEGYNVQLPSRVQEQKDKILLHHFYHKTLDEDVPCLYCTVFHEGVDIPAKYEPYGYDHGQYPAHALRFEKHERPILSSRGICELAYTWEQEMKTQRDGRANRTELELRPPLFAPYQDVLRVKREFEPGIVFAERRPGNFRWMDVPPMPMGSIEIEKATMDKVDRYFGLFGLNVDPAKKQLRQQEAGDMLLKELKPVFRQVFKLMQQYLPDPTAERVAGSLERPFQVSRDEIQGEYEYSATWDARDLDPQFLKEKLGYMAQLAQMDTIGVLDKVKLIQIGAEAIDYSLADVAVQDAQAATNKEIESEQNAADLIIGSGQDQPLPMGANYGLRKQVLQSKMQGIQTNPATSKIIQSNPDILQVLMKRMQFFERQLQQEQNAQIGRMQVTNTFDKNAPQSASPMSPDLSGGGGAPPMLTGGGGGMPQGGGGGY